MICLIKKTIFISILVNSFFILPAYGVQLAVQTPSDSFVPEQIFIVDVMLDASNPGNHEVVVADAVIEYETEMLELLNIDANSSISSDFYYNYSTSNAFLSILTTTA